MSLEGAILARPEQLKELYALCSIKHSNIGHWTSAFNEIQHREVYVCGPRHTVSQEICDIALTEYDKSGMSPKDRERAERGDSNVVSSPLGLSRLKKDLKKCLPLKWQVYHLAQNNGDGVTGFVLEYSVDVPQKVDKSLRAKIKEIDLRVIAELIRKANGKEAGREGIVQREIKASEADYLARVINQTRFDEDDMDY